VTVAFLYNAAAGPLRTAFARTPIYNVTGVYPSSAAAAVAPHISSEVTDDDCVKATLNITSNFVYAQGTTYC